MAVINRTFAFGIMGSILVFALIHLGVSIGIIASYRHYGDIFTPQVGLSSFNLVIALFGFITGLLGLAAILMNSEGTGKIYLNRKNYSRCSIFVIYLFLPMIHS